MTWNGSTAPCHAPEEPEWLRSTPQATGWVPPRKPPLTRSITTPEVKKFQGIEVVPSDSTYGTGDRERCGRFLSGTSRSLTVNDIENIDQEDS